MANIDILKNFEEIEFVRDSAVCKVRANEYATTSEVVPIFEYVMIDNNIAVHSGMKFEINGVAIEWISVHYAQDFPMPIDYYALVKVIDVSPVVTFPIETIAARIATALKNHPNYTTFSKYAYVHYDGNDNFSIVAKRADVLIKRYTSFSYGNATFNHPSTSIIEEEYKGVLNSAVTPYELSGAIAAYKEDFKLIVDVNVYTPGIGHVLVTENYYPDKKGSAEIDVAGIVNKYFKKEWLIFNSISRNNEALIDVEVKISSYFDDSLQSSVDLNFKALDAYTGLENKSNHIAVVNSYFNTDAAVSFLTALPEHINVHAAAGVLLQIILRRVVNLDGINNAIDGWPDSSSLKLRIIFNDPSTPNEFVFINIGMAGTPLTFCGRYFIDKALIEAKISGNYEDIRIIVVNMNGLPNAEFKYLYLDHKVIGDEQTFLFKNRFGVMEQLVARGGTTESLDMEKRTAQPMKAWNSAETDGNVSVYANQSQSTGSASVGFMGKQYKEYLKDFLNSSEIYLLKEDLKQGIQIEDGSFDLEASIENMKSLEFEYRFNHIKRT